MKRLEIGLCVGDGGLMDEKYPVRGVNFRYQ